MKKYVLILLIAVIAIYSTSSVRANTTTQIEIAGTIRNDGTGWKFINDEYHSPKNLTRIEVSGNYIIVYYGVKASKILTFVVSPDETFAKMGVVTGASVGVYGANIMVTKEQPALKGYITKDASGYKLWNNEYVNSVAWDETAGELTIYHEDNDGYDISLFNRNPQVTAIISDSTGAVSKDKTVIKFVKNGQFYKPQSDDEVQLYFAKGAKRKIVNPNELVSTSGNLWIYGLIEVENATE